MFLSKERADGRIIVVSHLITHAASYFQIRENFDHSFWGRLIGREKVDLGSLLSLSGMKLPVCLKVIVCGK